MLLPQLLLLFQILVLFIFNFGSATILLQLMFILLKQF